MSLALGIAIAAALLCCYVASCNIALKTFSRKRLTDRLVERDREERLEPLVNQLPRLLLLTGVLRAALTLVIVLAIVYLIDEEYGPLRWPIGYLAAFLISAVVMAVFVVAIPVSWARYGREALVDYSAPGLKILAFLFLPLLIVLEGIDPVVRRISGADLNGDDEHAISEEVLSVVEEHDHQHNVDAAQKEMIEAVFELPTTTAGEIMTPRTDVQGIEVGGSLDEVVQAVREGGHSRLPVYEENLDSIVGMLYAKDLLRFLSSDGKRVERKHDGAGDGKFQLRGVLREAFLVPESKSVRELLAEFKARKVHIAVVLDEYGGTAGVVTIEDILEEIVGEIQDEYELLEELPQVQQVDEQTIEVDARLYVDDLNDAFGLELPEDEDYDTVGGFVFSTLGHIPQEGEAFSVDEEGKEGDTFRFTVTAAERTKVLRVRVEKLEEAETRQPADEAA